MCFLPSLHVVQFECALTPQGLEEGIETHEDLPLSTSVIMYYYPPRHPLSSPAQPASDSSPQPGTYVQSHEHANTRMSKMIGVTSKRRPCTPPAAGGPGRFEKVTLRVDGWRQACLDEHLHEGCKRPLAAAGVEGLAIGCLWVFGV